MAVTLPARSGLARSGASRFNAYARYNGADTVNVVVLINGVDVSAAVLKGLSYHLALNDQPSTARFTLRPWSGVTASAGQLATIALGAANNIEFAGQIVKTTFRYVRGVTNPFIDCDCIDWKRLLDRRLITQEWTSTSATQIALDIINLWTSGFTTEAVATGLATIDNFVCTNEAPSSALRRLANLVAGGFHIDGRRRLHLFGSGGDTSAYAGTAPQTLTISPTLWSLKAFQYADDASQIRTRSTVEYQQTKTLVAIAAGQGTGSHSGVSPYNTIPIDDGSVLAGSGTVRIGSNVLLYTGSASVAALGSSVGSPAAAGATAVYVGDPTQFFSHGWVKAGQQVFYYDAQGPGYSVAITAITAGTPTTVQTASAHYLQNGYSVTISGSNSTPNINGTWTVTVVDATHFTIATTTTGNGTTGTSIGGGSLVSIPASGYGSLGQALSQGQQITQVAAITLQGYVGGFLTNVGYVTYDAPIGTAVVGVITVDAAGAQAALAALEGGDGVHQSIDTNSQLTATGATDLANANLSVFDADIIEPAWETEDLNAKPGRPQAVNIGALSTTLTILTADVTFPRPNCLPRRRCTASSIRTAGLIDTVVTNQP